MGVLNLYSTFASQMMQLLRKQLWEHHRKNIFLSAWGFSSSSVLNLENCLFRASIQTGKIFHLVVKEEKVKWEVSWKGCVGHSDRAVAFQQVSFPEHDRTWPWWCWCFLSVPVLDEESGATSLQSHSTELCCHREQLSCWQVMNSLTVKGGLLPSPPSWKKKWNQSFIPKLVCLVPEDVNRWVWESQGWKCEL